MTLQEFRERDNNFDETSFITKVNNIVVKFFNSITLNEVKKIDHFVSDKVFEIGNKLATDAETSGNIHMFDEFNIARSSISSIEESNDAYVIYVRMTLKYMDYVINKASGALLSGNNSFREPHEMTMVFKKYKGAREQNLVRTCPTCGASLNTNNTGICEYCHTVYNQEDHDWVLDDIQGFRY